MNNINLDNRSGIRYMGVDWRGKTSILPVKSKDALIFCDLRGCILDGLDLSMVQFFGCRLNGTSFRGATLRETQFIGCFSSHYGPPTDFRSCIWEDVLLIDSHLNCLSDHDISSICCWSTELADVASDTLSERNDARYNSAIRLGALDNPIVAPILGCLLSDEEWDVRSGSLRVLGELRLRHGSFPRGDQVLMEWMFLRLGDRSAFVRSTAIELIKLLSPPDDVLLAVINKIKADVSEERVIGLRAATTLLKFDIKYALLLDLSVLKSVLSDESPEVRSECLQLLGILDDSSTIPWILTTLSDSVALVRVNALLAICALSEPVPASHIIPLLNDSDEQVRIQSLYTLEEIGDFDLKDVEIALSDPSDEVCRIAQRLLEKA